MMVSIQQEIIELLASVASPAVFCRIHAKLCETVVNLTNTNRKKQKKSFTILPEILNYSFKLSLR